MIALTHCLDHMQRLHERCEEDEDRARTASTAPELLKLHDILMNSISEDIEDIANSHWTQYTSRANKTADLIHKEVEPLRATILEEIARDTLDVDTATHYLEAIRWLTRVSQHIARISFHFEQAILAAGK
jgi:phosphate:Na+ symporter